MQEEPQQVTMKDPKKVEVGERLVAINHKKTEVKKREEAENGRRTNIKELGPLLLWE